MARNEVGTNFAMMLLGAVAASLVCMVAIPSPGPINDAAPRTTAPEGVVAELELGQVKAAEATETTESVSPSAPPGDDEPIEIMPDLEDIFDEHDIEYEEAVVDLGRQLFHEPKLSSDNSISCATCHDLRYSGTDRTRFPTGLNGKVGEINTPTVFNSVFNIGQFWDGRAKDLKQQAGGPIEAKGEMGGASWNDILERLRSDASYVARFVEAFDEVTKGSEIDRSHVLDAISMFEMTLVTPGSRFDKWVGGDAKALTREELQGYQLFKDVGCGDCHFGPHAGGQTYQRLGAKNEFFTDNRRSSHVDYGRYNHTGAEKDRHVFKVPTLRNIGETAPYFHDGSQSTLEDAVRSMAHYQLGTDLSDHKIDLIVKFLHTLTGEYQGRPVQSGR